MSLGIINTIVNKRARPQFQSLNEDAPKPIPGCKLGAFTQQVIDDWHHFAKQKGAQIWKEEEYGPSCLGYDGAICDLQATFDRFNKGKEFNQMILPDLLENGYHDSIEVCRVGVRGTAVNKSYNPSTSPEDQRNGRPGLYIRAVNQNVLDDFIRTVRTITPHVWREGRGRRNRFGYDSKHFELLWADRHYEAFDSFRGLVDFTNLKFPRHDQSEGLEDIEEMAAKDPQKKNGQNNKAGFLPSFPSLW
ncbi:hypothetical protein BDW74DRAFT_180999 [Aspergillus multicolor]|uniref:uncharacterized protein n=1 Tax=Aspergillus multicolor TaxID=41759 RepID=UPI003CCCB571